MSNRLPQSTVGSRRLASRLAALSLITLIATFASRGTGEGAAPYVSPYFWNDTIKPDRIMVVGDLQKTSWMECRFLGREQNDAARRYVVEAMAEEKPEMVLLLGDQVCWGEDEAEWLAFDSLMSPVTRAGVPVYGIIGNHDYGIIRKAGLSHCHARFPNVVGKPALATLGDSVVLVSFDSNFEQLTTEAREEQARKYRVLLERLDADPAVRGVIVATHHPPYTNSDLTPDPQLVDDFAKPFQEARKTLLFLAGHIHSYERFDVDGKAFVTSGGGGGPRRLIDTSESRPNKTDVYRRGTWRRHNYVRLSLDDGRLVGETMMLVGNEFKMGDRFVLPFEG